MPPKQDRRGLRRPAAAVVARRRPSQGRLPMRTESEKDGPKKFEETDPRELMNLGAVVLEDANYYGKSAPLAGFFTGLKTEGEEWFAELKVTGTKHSELLRVLTGKNPKVVWVHLCAEDCAEQLTDELLVHAKAYQKVELGRVPWLTNLKEVGEEEAGIDEMAD